MGGYIHHLTYGADLRARLDDSLLNRLTDELIRQRFFTLPVADFYWAAVDALNSGEHLASGDDQDDGTVRDLLARLIKALDDRRPWPEPAFKALPVDETLNFMNTPLIACMSILPRDVEARLSRSFSKREPGGRDGEFIALRLRTGQQVVLRAATFRVADVEVYSADDPEATRAALEEFTGLEVQPAEP
ncbi:hypothetical protein A5634_10530 [Mycobacterium asiaticum]|uniref:Uncharacterized protein n=1 Tax=Mycobacterium asiaticum TaxID=1790 RepID=A0A1A3NJL2_MYCAS|nr:hypothetical protein A5634_10530 [Mycobacterium asiaticum]